MSLEQIVDYYEEITGTLDKLYVQHSTELEMIKELLGVIYKAEELTPSSHEGNLDWNMLAELNEHWQDVA